MAQNAPADWDRTVQQRLCSGEAAALGESYDRFASLVHGLALRVLTEDTAADRVTGEVFTRLWQSPEDYDPARGPLRSWLAELTHRLAVQRLHRVRATAPDADGAAGLALTVHKASVAARADHLMTSMPAPLRAALDLAYFKRRECRRIAEELGITVDETRRRLRRGLQLMATAYDTGRGAPPPEPAPSPGPGPVPRLRLRLRETDVSRTGHGHPEVPGRPDAGPAPAPPLHGALTSLLGAWALAVCSPQEAEAVERHLGGCGACADEALRLRDAIGLLRPATSLDLDPALRARILQAGFARRAPHVPVPAWAAPYDAETARLDALLQDIDAPDWHAPVLLRWYEDDLPVSRGTTVADVLAHLLAVDGLVAAALGLGADEHTEAGRGAPAAPRAGAVRTLWRDQSHRMVRTAASAALASGGGDGGATGDRAPHGIAALPVPYGDVALPLCDALVDRAFECWIHGSDIAAAVDYPYGLPVPRHMHAIVDLMVRRLPGALAVRRGPAARRAPAAGDGRGRMLRLEVEGAGGGEWLLGLDAPGATRIPGGRSGSRPPGREVAHVALDDAEFCRLAAGRIAPEEAVAGTTGDRAAIMDALRSVASLSHV